MEIRAEFCISHGDEMRLYGMTVVVPTKLLDHVMAKTSKFVVDWHYENIAAHLITGVTHEIEEGRMGENAHLVTHPQDR